MASRSKSKPGPHKKYVLVTEEQQHVICPAENPTLKVHEPHEDEGKLHADWTFITAKMFLGNALCLRRRGQPSCNVSVPDEARATLNQIFETCFPEMLQWIPHRTVRVEKGQAFYSDAAKSKVLSIAEIKGVTGYSLSTLRHQKLDAFGWRLNTSQFRGAVLFSGFII